MIYREAYELHALHPFQGLVSKVNWGWNPGGTESELEFSALSEIRARELINDLLMSMSADRVLWQSVSAVRCPVLVQGGFDSKIFSSETGH